MITPSVYIRIYRLEHGRFIFCFLLTLVFLTVRDSGICKCSLAKHMSAERKKAPLGM